MFDKKLYNLIVFVAILLSHADSYKILLFPVNIKSHLISFGNFGRALVETGNQAHLLVPSNNIIDGALHPEVKSVVYKSVDGIPWVTSDECHSMELDFIETRDGSQLYGLYKAVTFAPYYQWQINRDCESLFTDRDMIQQLSNERYDLIVVDSIRNAVCTPMLAYKLNLPFVVYTVASDEWFYSIPRQSNIPGAYSVYSDRTTFAQRLENFAVDLLEYLTLNSTSYYSEKFVPEKTPISAFELHRSALFLFFEYDSMAIFPSPSMPNTLEIGDVFIRPPKPLNKNLLEVVNSKRTVLYVAFGASNPHLPNSVSTKLCEAFENLDRSIQIVWTTQTTSLPCAELQNIYIKPWFPQNDVLAHANVKLVITHCGFATYTEAISHGKPLICLPLAGDRRRYAIAMETKGLGFSMDILTFSSNTLLHNINEMLQNSSYTEAVVHLSKKKKVPTATLR